LHHELEIILQGGGDHARVVLDCLLDNGSHVSAIFDPKMSGDMFGVPQLGKYDPSAFGNAQAVIAIGDNGIRKAVALNTKHAFANAIHSSANISSRSSMGVGCMILHRAIIQANSKIGHHVIINTGSQIDHDCQIGDYVHIAPGAVLCGTVSVGEGTFVGAGTVIIPGKKIGAWATIGAGAVVISDIPDFAVAVGNPAKVIKINRP
jgi:sugar O-acyltransferase (sialic acid O-acetyltransferase NeuD family)